MFIIVMSSSANQQKATTATTTATTTKKVGVSAKRKRKQRGAQVVPSRKRFAPRAAPGLPGRGGISTYHAIYRDSSVWILDSAQADDLATRGSFGKGL